MKAFFRVSCAAHAVAARCSLCAANRRIPTNYYCSTRRDLKTCDAPNSRAPICDALAIDVLYWARCPSPRTGARPYLTRANIQATISKHDLSTIRAEVRALKQAFMDDQIEEHIYAARRRVLEARQSVAELPATTFDTAAGLRCWMIFAT